MLSAKDVAGIESSFVRVLEHIPGTKTRKQEYFQSRGIRVPKTNYESMWMALAERLHRSGAASAVFDCLQTFMPARLKELLQRSRRGRTVSLRSNEPAIIRDFYFENGNLRRIGQLFLEDLDSRGGRVGKAALPAARKPPKSARDYDIAFSFAGEDRPFVEEVANELRSLGIRVFYDRFEEADLLGKDLVAHLGDIYRTKARYCAMFISAHYVRKAWPQLERQHAQARALRERGEYILPIRMDDTEVPGLSPTIGYKDARGKSPRDIAGILHLKIGANL